MTRHVFHHFQMLHIIWQHLMVFIITLLQKYDLVFWVVFTHIIIIWNIISYILFLGAKTPLQIALFIHSPKSFKIATYCNKWKVTSERWQVTGNNWQVTVGKWHVTSDRWQVTGEKLQVMCDSWHVTVTVTKYQMSEITKC